MRSSEQSALIMPHALWDTYAEMQAKDAFYQCVDREASESKSEENSATCLWKAQKRLRETLQGVLGEHIIRVLSICRLLTPLELKNLFLSCKCQQGWPGSYEFSKKPTYLHFAFLKQHCVLAYRWHIRREQECRALLKSTFETNDRMQGSWESKVLNCVSH